MADVLSVGVNLEAFAQAISAIQALRSSVSRVFDCLKDGMRNKETLEGREKAFIAHFQDNLHSVNRDLNELERLSNLVGKPSENHPLHNSGLLSLDPVQDKTPLYSQLLQAYKWSNKVPGAICTEGAAAQVQSRATGWKTSRRCCCSVFHSGGDTQSESDQNVATPHMENL
uniref:Mediator complex subunit 27 n=1 Tax=Ovis aries TaxID=9940 RepID=A0AC11E4F4_SHEEP